MVLWFGYHVRFFLYLSFSVLVDHSLIDKRLQLLPSLNQGHVQVIVVGADFSKQSLKLVSFFARQRRLHLFICLLLFSDFLLRRRFLFFFCHRPRRRAFLLGLVGCIASSV